MLKLVHALYNATDKALCEEDDEIKMAELAMILEDTRQVLCVVECTIPEERKCDEIMRQVAELVYRLEVITQEE